MLQNVLAKCSTDRDQIQHKVDLGFNQFEVQLLSEDDYKNTDWFYSFPQIKVIGVHTPLIDKEDVQLENILVPRYYRMFLGACMFAQKASDYFDRRVYVVLHNGLSTTQYKNFEPLTQKILDVLLEVTRIYPDIDIVIENCSPAESNSSLRNGTIMSDLVETVNYFNEIAGKKLLGICFDTCHYMMTVNFYKKWLANNEITASPTFEQPLLDFKDVFKQYASLIRVIHLNNMKKNGTSKETHSTAFTNSAKDKETLMTILYNYNKYDCPAYITLEVNEKDYLNAKNLVMTYDNVCNTFNEIHIGVLQQY